MPDRTSLRFFLRHRCASNVRGMEAPRTLSCEAIEEFKSIYEKEFAHSISDDEAHEMALPLLRLFEILLRPSPSNTSDQIDNGS